MTLEEAMRQRGMNPAGPAAQQPAKRTERQAPTFDREAERAQRENDREAERMTKQAETAQRRLDNETRAQAYQDRGVDYTKDAAGRAYPIESERNRAAGVTAGKLRADGMADTSSFDEGKILAMQPKPVESPEIVALRQAKTRLGEFVKYQKTRVKEFDSTLGAPLGYDDKLKTETGPLSSIEGLEAQASETVGSMSAAFSSAVTGDPTEKAKEARQQLDDLVKQAQASGADVRDVAGLKAHREALRQQRQRMNEDVAKAEQTLRAAELAYGEKLSSAYGPIATTVPTPPPAVEKKLASAKPDTSDPEVSFWSEFGKNAADLGRSFGAGAGGLVKMVGDIYGLTTGDMDNAASNFGKYVQEFWNEGKSDDLKAREQQRQQAVAAAPTEFGKALEWVKSTVSDPSLLANAVSEQVPQLVPSMGAGAVGGKVAAKVLLRKAVTDAAKIAAAARAASIGTKVGIAAGGFLQGADVGGDSYADTLARLEKMSEAEALAIPEIKSAVAAGNNIDVAKAAYALAQGRKVGVAAGTISILANGLLPAGDLLERAAAGEAAGAAAGEAAGSLGREVAKAAAKTAGEAISEGVEEGGGLAASNIAARQGVDPTRPITKGMGETIAQAATVGAIAGGPAAVSEMNVAGKETPPASPQAAPEAVTPPPAAPAAEPAAPTDNDPFTPEVDPELAAELNQSQGGMGEGQAAQTEPAPATPAPATSARTARASATLEGLDNGLSGLTQEAQDLISSIAAGSAAPAFISKNLERIAKENGVTITDKMRPSDVIEAIRQKGRKSTPSAPVETAPEPTPAPDNSQQEPPTPSGAENITPEPAQAAGSETQGVAGADPQPGAAPAPVSDAPQFDYTAASDAKLANEAKIVRAQLAKKGLKPETRVKFEAKAAAIEAEQKRRAPMPAAAPSGQAAPAPVAPAADAANSASEDATVTLPSRAAAQDFATRWTRATLEGTDMSKTQPDGTVRLTLRNMTPEKKQMLERMVADASRPAAPTPSRPPVSESDQAQAPTNAPTPEPAPEAGIRFVPRQNAPQVAQPAKLGGTATVEVPTKNGSMTVTGSPYVLPGFEEIEAVVAKPTGSKKEATKTGWRVYEKSTGMMIAESMDVPGKPTSEQDAVSLAMQTMRANGKPRFIEKLNRFAEAVNKLRSNASTPSPRPADVSKTESKANTSAPTVKDSLQVAAPAPIVARGANTPAEFVKQIAASTGLKGSDAPLRATLDLAVRLNRAAPDAFRQMEVFALSESEWAANPNLAAQTPESAAAYNPETNTLYLRTERVKEPTALVSAFVHESGHFAERFALPETVIAREWAKLDDAQIEQAAADYNPNDQRSAAEIRKDPRARSEWVAQQFARVVAGKAQTVPAAIRAKLQAFFDAMKEFATKWLGSEFAKSGALDAEILRVMGFDEDGNAAATAPTVAENAAVAAPAPDVRRTIADVPRMSLLNKPIKGKDGTSIVGYEWRSEISDKWSSREGALVSGRVSNWDRAATSEGTGRQIVHVYYVQRADGTVTIEGINSAQSILGITQRRLQSIAETERLAQITRAKAEKQTAESYEKAKKPTAAEALKNYFDRNMRGVTGDYFAAEDRLYGMAVALQSGDGFVVLPNGYDADVLRANGWTEVPLPSRRELIPLRNPEVAAPPPSPAPTATEPPASPATPPSAPRMTRDEVADAAIQAARNDPSLPPAPPPEYETLKAVQNKANRAPYSPDALTPERLSSAESQGLITKGKVPKLTDFGRDNLRIWSDMAKVRDDRMAMLSDKLVDEATWKWDAENNPNSAAARAARDTPSAPSPSLPAAGGVTAPAAVAEPVPASPTAGMSDIDRAKAAAALMRSASMTGQERPTFRVWDMMGDAGKWRRQTVMSALLGRKASLAESGVSAITKEFARILGVNSSEEDVAKKLEEISKETQTAEAQAPTEKIATELGNVKATVENADAGPVVAPTTSEDKKVARMADRKQLRVQKEFLVDALTEAAKTAPEQLVMSDEGKADLALPLRNEGQPNWKAVADANARMLADKYGVSYGFWENPASEGSLSFAEQVAQAIRSRHAEHVTVEVPGDGTFRVPNTKADIRRLAERVKKQFGTGIGAVAPRTPPTGARPIAPLAKKVTTEAVTKAVGLAAAEEPLTDAKGNPNQRAVMNYTVQDGAFTVASNGRVLTVAAGGNGTPKAEVEKKGYNVPKWRNIMEASKKLIKLGDSTVSAKGKPRATGDSGEILKVLNRIEGLREEKKEQAIFVHAVDGKIGLSFSSAKVGDFRSENVPPGHRAIAAVNPDYLRTVAETARSLGVEQIDLHTEGTSEDWRNPLVFFAGDNAVSVVMPIRVRDADIFAPNSMASEPDAATPTPAPATPKVAPAAEAEMVPKRQYRAKPEQAAKWEAKEARKLDEYRANLDRIEQQLREESDAAGFDYGYRERAYAAVKAAEQTPVAERKAKFDQLFDQFSQDNRRPDGVIRDVNSLAGVKKKFETLREYLWSRLGNDMDKAMRAKEQANTQAKMDADRPSSNRPTFSDTRRALLAQVDEAIGKAAAEKGYERDALLQLMKEKGYSQPKNALDREMEAAAIARRARELAEAASGGPVVFKAGTSTYRIANTREALEKFRKMVARPLMGSSTESLPRAASSESQEQVRSVWEKLPRNASEAQRRGVIDAMSEETLKRYGLDKDYTRVAPGVVMPKEGAEALAKLKAGEQPEFDVLGAPAERQTETPEFKRWFGDSKVVDAEGNPRVMYHGTSADVDFVAFDEAKMDPKALFGPGIYTTANPAIAGGTDGQIMGYAGKGEGEASRVLPLFVKIEKPFDADEFPDSPMDVAEEMDRVASNLFDEATYLGIDFDLIDRMETAQNVDNGSLFLVLARAFASDKKANAQRVLREMGHDGIIHTGGLSAKWNPDVKTPHVVAIAFKPEQVKSAIGNRGTFDPANPSILGTPAEGSPLNPPKNGEVPGTDGAQRYRSHTDTLIERGYQAVGRVPYDVRTNAAAKAQAKAFRTAAGDAVAAAEVFNAASKLPGAVRVALGVEIERELAARRYDTKATPEQRAEAIAAFTRFSQALAALGTESGQTSQAFNLVPDITSADGALHSATQGAKQRQDQMLGEDGVKTEREIIDAMNAENGKVVDRLLDEAKADLRRVKVNKRMVERTVGELPKSKKDLDAAIKRAFEETGRRISDIIRTHHTQVDAIGTNLVDKLTQEAGLSQVDAEKLAEAVRARMQTLTDKAKRAVLEKLGREKKGVSKRIFTLVDRIIEMSNAGALDVPALRGRIAEELKLPRVTDALAQRLKELTDKAQQAPEGFQRDRVETDILDELRKVKGIGPVDIATAIYYANILSGYTTQFVNIISTGLNVAAELANEVARSESDALLGRNGAKPGRATKQALAGLADGARTGFLQAASILKTGYAAKAFDEKLPEVSPILELIAKEEAKGAMKGVKGYALAARYVTRAMKAADTVFFRSASEAYQRVAAAKLAGALDRGMDRSEANRKIRDMLAISPADFEQARTQAREEGLDGLDYQLRVGEIIHQKRRPDIVGTASRFAQAATFNSTPRGALGIIARKVGETAQAVPPLKLFVPFTNIVANVTNASLNYSPLGGVRAIRGYAGEANMTAAEREKAGIPSLAEERASLAVKATAGTMAMIALLAYGLSAGDDDEPIITATGPKDTDQRNQLRRSGWKPHSIKIGDTYVSYLTSPAAVPLAFVGNWIDGVRYNGLSEKDLVGAGTQAAVGIGSTITDMSFLRGVADLFDTLRGAPGASPEKWAAGVATSALVPNLVKQVDQTFDPTLRQAKTLGENVQGAIPGLRQQLPERLTPTGTPIESSPLGRFGGVATNDPLWDTLNRKGAVISDVRSAKIGNRDATPEELRLIVKESGPRIESRLRAALPSIQRMSDEQAADYVKSVAREERARARQMLPVLTRKGPPVFGN